MENAKYKDLHIVGDSIELDALKQPVLIFDRDVIAQDIKHALRESGLLELLIGERSKDKRKMIFIKIKILVESDSRIEPGTAKIEQALPGELYISANSEFGQINLGVVL